jgi:serine/threonine protein kinase
MIGQDVFKCYDYRIISDRYRAGEVCRNPQWYQLSDLNVKYVVDWSDTSNNSSDYLKIIKYPFVEGTHQPIYVNHLVLVMQKLLSIHDKNVVHGDLRFANIIFSKAGVSPIYSKLIDFDYSGVDGEHMYPDRFNLDIPDGKRHCEVSPGELLRKKHDVYSFKWMCSQYRPKNKDYHTCWQEWIDNEDSDLTQGVEIFEKIGDEEELESVMLTFKVPVINIKRK